MESRSGGPTKCMRPATPDAGAILPAESSMTLTTPPPVPAQPFFAWASPSECQWIDLVAREPHRQPARDLLRALGAVTRPAGDQCDA